VNELSPAPRILLACLALAACATTRAQSSCDSDREPRPVALLERFISADCESCWTDAKTPRAAKGDLVLDWIVPGARGDDAPLAAAATRDARPRLEALHRPPPAAADTARHGSGRADHRLRVAQGPAFNGYIGTSIALQPGRGGPWQAWLVLVETLPAGTEGSPVERNLVRNAFRPDWDGARPLSKKEQSKLYESRPMQIPEGARPDRLRVVGWVEDAQGRIRGIAQSRCASPKGKG